jgi:hypothetical protein
VGFVGNPEVHASGHLPTAKSIGILQEGAKGSQEMIRICFADWASYRRMGASKRGLLGVHDGAEDAGVETGGSGRLGEEAENMAQLNRKGPGARVHP